MKKHEVKITSETKTLKDDNAGKETGFRYNYNLTKEQR